MDFERLDTVIARSGMAKATIYRDIKAGLFPPPVKIGATAVWSREEISALNKARLAGASEEALRGLVAGFVRQRSALAA